MFKKLMWCFIMASVLQSCNYKNEYSAFHHPKDNITESRKGAINSIQWEGIPETWQLISDNIICKTPYKDSLYTVYNVGNMEFVTSFGKKGHGNLEWIAPHLFKKNDSTFVVFDSGTKKIYTVTREDISYSRTSSINDPINNPKTISYPTVAYVSLSPNEQSLKIINIETDELIDKLSFIDEKGQGQSSLYDFEWDTINDKIVLANLHSDSFIICTIDANGRILCTDYYEAGTSFSKDKLFYFSVQCGKYIYLLSQKNVDIKNLEGYSEIEVYDYNGKGIYKITLDFIAREMLLDPSRNRILTTSVTDDLLHIVSL